MKIGKIELSDWKSGKHWNVRFSFNHTDVSLYRLEEGREWEPSFNGELIFCRALYTKTFANLEEAKTNMDDFLIRLNQLMAFQ